MIGLEIGDVMRSLRQESQRLFGRKVPAVYIALASTDSDRRLLERARVPYAVCDGNLVVFGRPAVELAPVFHVPRLQMLPEGRLPEGDPLARQLTAALLECLLPPPAAAGTPCVLALSRTRLDRPLGESPEWEFFSRLIRLRGYRPSLIDKTSALVLAELGRTGFTGLALLFESDSCSLALARQGRILARATILRGMSFIDEQLARSTGRIVWDMDGAGYVDLEAVARWKQTADPNLSAPAGPDAERLAAEYRRLLRAAIEEFTTRCRGLRRAEIPRGPLAVACDGVASRAAGFAPLLTEELQQAGLEIGDVRIADDPSYTISRGCLIQAELESGPIDRDLAAA